MPAANASPRASSRPHAPKGKEQPVRPAGHRRKTWTSLIGAPKLDFVLERESLFDEKRLSRDSLNAYQQE